MGIFGKKKKTDARAEDSAEPVEPDSEDPSIGRGPAWEGRALRLPAPPDATHASELAAKYVSVVAELDAVDLDYTLDSLQWVDEFLDMLGTAGSDEVAETVFTAGCYVGEVLVRGYGYRWIDAPAELAEMFGFRLVVIGPGGTYANPIGKAFKLTEQGPGDSVHFFAQAQIAADSRGPAGFGADTAD